jgi:hypothetical protein
MVKVMIGLVIRLTLAVLFAASTASPAQSQPASAKLAQELTATLVARHLDAFAARDPAAADRFVAAMVYPKVQLLVVAGRYSAPAALDASFAAANYRDIYAALQSAAPDSRVFVQDMGADGLRFEDKQRGDVVYEKVDTQTVFSGNVDDGDYKRKLAKADAAYSQMLQILVDALGATAGVGATAANR